MNFISFNVLLAIAGIPAAWLFSFGLALCILPMTPFLKTESQSKAMIYPIVILSGGYQIYFWGLWATFCVGVTMWFTQKPEVTWDWLYWLCGFRWCTALFGLLANQEKQRCENDEEARKVWSGLKFYVVIAIAAFIVFALKPSLAEIPYGWFTSLAGLAKYMNG